MPRFRNSSIIGVHREVHTIISTVIILPSHQIYIAAVLKQQQTAPKVEGQVEQQTATKVEGQVEQQTATKQTATKVE